MSVKQAIVSEEHLHSSSEEVFGDDKDTQDSIIEWTSSICEMIFIAEAAGQAHALTKGRWSHDDRHAGS